MSGASTKFDSSRGNETGAEVFEHTVATGSVTVSTSAYRTCVSTSGRQRTEPVSAL